MKRTMSAFIIGSAVLVTCGCGVSTDARPTSATDSAAPGPTGTHLDSVPTITGAISDTTNPPLGIPAIKLDYGWKIEHAVCDGCVAVSLEEASKSLGVPIQVPDALGAPSAIMAFPVPGMNIALKWKETPDFGAVAISFSNQTGDAMGSVTDLETNISNQEVAKSSGATVYGTSKVLPSKTRAALTTISDSKSGYYLKSRGGGVVIEIMAANASTDEQRAQLLDLIDSIASQYGDQPK